MQVPFPHAAFPRGDTVPFTVEVLTDEDGKPWHAASLGPNDALVIEITAAGGSRRGGHLEPVTGTAAAYTFFYGTDVAAPSGPYRYAIKLCREGAGYGSIYARVYTLLRGTFTLY